MPGLLRSGIIVCGALACATVAHAGPSTFQRTCSDIRLERPGGTTVSLEASCKDKAGRERPASLTLNGYHNIDGRVVYDGKGLSTFQHTCDVIDIRVKPDRVFLTAKCQTRDQGVRNTSTEIQDIHNIDGRLSRGGSTGPSQALAANAQSKGSSPLTPGAACGGLAGQYNGGASTITVSNGDRVRATVGPNRPAGTGTCNGKMVTINFPDDRTVSGVFNGRTIQWNNQTTWTKDQ